MSIFQRFFSSRSGPIIAGAVIGVIAPLLVKAGNPGNMGVCVACFCRDIAGALGLHRAAVVQYLRPEIIGFVFGSLLAALLFREFRPRGGASPIVRFVLGMLAAMGALVFLGCPWRMLLRLSGGDWNALVGFFGLATGVGLGSLFIRKGYTLGRSHPTSKAAGLVLPLLMAGLLLLLLFHPLMGRDATGAATGPVFFSAKGPGSNHAPIAISLAAGLAIGILAQRSRFCTVGGIRDLILLRDPHLFYGILALLVTAFVTNLALGQFVPGFEKQPIAHTDALWNFGGMLLAGLAFVLGGGCPGRMLILSGEGDTDAGVFVLGMLTGTALAHNFSIASSPTGPGIYGPTAVIIGLVVCTVLGFTMREPPSS